jgi:mono/diheme cytochrome c family protein
VSARALLGAVIAAAAVTSGCDDSVAFQEPDPSWNRMLTQKRADPYEPTEAFDDGRVLRRPPSGTIAHDEAAFEPPAPTRSVLDTGRARFEAFCAACHGMLGDGRSVVAEKMPLRKPPSFLEPRLAALEPRAIVAVIERGYGFMPSYADAIERRDRWAVAYYVKALQLARAAEASELPESLRAELEKEAP